ncbi:hypothetical protein FB567DRAFT_445029 [Paraphoma chrysanthemicola]|uniref:Cryptic loci regulator 2 N-terminal domain-containing protein n=1 Tax=Paraphoma chrysanthemicola TaxID=798071 RepID=A0A8K0R562_9PLEO|nr:hypothetical protein FB567DRAFT_445029 [Paraphoma chrysanthemicola]
MASNPVVVRLRPGCSDGDALHVPKQGGPHTQVNPPTPYLEKIGQQWMTDRGEAKSGVKYILEALPAGYTMWQRPRPGKPTHVDKYLFGHPGHKFFDSPNRFYPHFKHLMENNGSSIGCPCKLCAGSAGILPRSTSSSVRVASSSAASHSSAPAVQVPVSSVAPTLASAVMQSKGRPKLVSAGADSSRVDEEGTPDIYRNLIDKLKRHGSIDEMVEEPMSPDWRAEQDILPDLLQSLQDREQWIPRIGEIVLYIRNMRPGVDFVCHEVTGEMQLYDEEADKFLGSPPWEAGVVGEVPVKPSVVADLHANVDETNVIYSGVRIEPLPDPNGTDKSLSKRHQYIPLRQTRPFVLWSEMLQHVPQEQWHATIFNALTVASTLSLMGKYRVRGTWPMLDLYCHGLHVGHEMLIAGDTVRLLPNKSKTDQTRCVDILVIRSIRLKWTNLDLASNNDYDETHPYNSDIWIYGSAYTSDPKRMATEQLSKDNAAPPKAASDYGEWYPLHPDTKELAVPFSRICGRLHERDAMTFWLNADADDLPDIDVGREALMEARSFARKNDRRIIKMTDGTWFWGDSRAEALDLHTINGLDISKYDQERDIRDMRKNIKVIDGLAKAKPGKATTLADLGAKGLRSFMAPGTTDLPDRTSLMRAASTSESATSSNASEAAAPRKKRPHVVNLSDDDNEDEEEIRMHTRIVQESERKAGKKAKVMVVID